MFETLSQGFSNALEKLTKQGVLREDEISSALREVRMALLDADVTLDITKNFIKSVGEKARGQAVTKSVTPGQQVIKIVHDELIKVLAGPGEISNALKIDNPPATILMTCCPGVTDLVTACPRAFSPTDFINLFVISKVTSASKRATLTSRKAVDISSSLSTPCLVSFPRALENPCDKVSNINTYLFVD